MSRELATCAKCLEDFDVDDLDTAMTCEDCLTASPKKFAFDITLHINEFEAASIEEAEEMLNGYIDRLAQVEDAVIQWDSLDLTEVDTRLA